MKSPLVRGGFFVAPLRGRARSAMIARSYAPARSCRWNARAGLLASPCASTLKPPLSPGVLGRSQGLLELRLRAMRESLERIGRFNPARARSRFLADFDPALMQVAAGVGRLVGCSPAGRKIGTSSMSDSPKAKPWNVYSASASDAAGGASDLKRGALRPSQAPPHDGGPVLRRCW